MDFIEMEISKEMAVLSSNYKTDDVLHVMFSPASNARDWTLS
jgi:hypothetical protein